MDPKWLEWAEGLQAIAQTGITFAHNPFDKERYEEVRRIAAEIMSSHSDADFERVHDLFTKEVGYATPKVDVRAAVFRDDAILMVTLREDGKWTLPGGWADVNESPAEAVAREVFEESGYQVRPVKLLAVYDSHRHPSRPFPFQIYTLFFRCEIVGGGAAKSIETEDVDFFHEGSLPDLSLIRVTPEQVKRLFEYYRHPEWPTDFD